MATLLPFQRHSLDDREPRQRQSTDSRNAKSFELYLANVHRRSEQHDQQPLHERSPPQLQFEPSRRRNVYRKLGREHSRRSRFDFRAESRVGSHGFSNLRRLPTRDRPAAFFCNTAAMEYRRYGEFYERPSPAEIRRRLSQADADFGSFQPSS